MSKKYKGKLCVYCGTKKATTADHVFARQFFLERDRGNLPVVPACERCNGQKAVLENYLTSVLPFGGRHGQAVETLESGVPKRLDGNHKLRRHLQRTMTPAWVREGSSSPFVRTSMFSFEGSKLEELLKYIAPGLAYHHWDAYIDPGYYASVMFMPDTVGMAFQQMVQSWRVGARASNNLGQGTISYEGIQAADAPGLTIWLFAMFGGVMLADGNRPPSGQPTETSSRWWAITGPVEIAEQIEHLKGSRHAEWASSREIH